MADQGFKRKPSATPASPNRSQTMRKIVIVYLVSTVLVLVIFFIFGRRSIENIGNGFIYGSVGLALFGALLLAGNTVPAQLSKLSLPTVRRHQENESDGASSKNEAKRFFFTILMYGAFIFVTGLILKLL